MHSTDINAQSFTLIDPGFQTIHNTAASWVDLDNDGDLDVFVSGSDENDLITIHLYKNEGNDTFNEVITFITPCSYAACAFGDIDNDGLADLALSGYDGNINICKVYLNDGDMQFTDIGAGIEGVAEGSLAWADYDHDGYSDLLISGLDNTGNPTTRLYKNEGGADFTEIVQPLAGLYKSSLACFDIDKDQDIDFAICGLDENDIAHTYVYVNEDGDYTELGAGLPGLWGGMLDWGDCNNDGFADLVISGSDDNGISQSQVYESDSGSSFTALAGPFNAVSNGSSFWGDFNNDGSLDLLIAGMYLSGISPLPPPDDPFMYIYHNQDDGTFLPQWVDKPIPNMNDIVCGDYDNDSDLDLLLTGSFVNAIGDSSDHTIILRNNASASNNPPSAPTELDYSVSGNEMSFQWTASTDDHTPADGLNYNLRIGSQADNMDLMSVLADLTNGYRRVVEKGNAGPNTEKYIIGLPFGEYYVSVQAIDHSFAGSFFSNSIEILYLPTATFTVVDTSCTGEIVSLWYTGNASPSAVYDWDFDGAEVVTGGNGPTPVIKWYTPGLKTVTLIVTENGMTSIPVSHDVMIYEPVISAGTLAGETEFCQGTDTTNYIVSPISGADFYHWELDPSNAGTIVSIDMVAQVVWDPDFAGTAYLSVSGANFCGLGPVSNILEIIVEPKPGIPGTPEGLADLCQNPSNSTYTTSPALPGESYDWGLIPEEAGTIIQNGLAEIEVNWSGTYTGDVDIFVVFENTCGTGPTSDTLDIIIKESPIAYAGEDTTINHLTTAQLQGSASGGSQDYTFYWTPDDLLEDATLSNPQTISLEFTTDFVLQVTDDSTGCTGLDTVRVNIINGPLSVDAVADPPEVCEGNSTTLEAIPTGGSGDYFFTWTSDPPGFTSNEAEPEVIMNETTTFYVEVTDGVQNASDSVEVEVYPLPAPSADIEGPMSVCEGDDNILFEINPVANATYYIWELSEGMFGSSDSTSILVSFANPIVASTGVITVWAANDCGPAIDSSSLAITIESVPNKPEMVFGPDSLCTTTDTAVQYTLEVPVPQATHYEWQVLPEEAGYIVGDGTTATMHWQLSWEGDAVIIVRALNDCGYSNWSDPFPVTTYACVSITEPGSHNAEVRIYPNPAREILNIDFRKLNEDADLYLGIYDIYGRQLSFFPLKDKDKRIQINISYLPQGLYVVRLSEHGQVLATKKLIISR